MGKMGERRMLILMVVTYLIILSSWIWIVAIAFKESVGCGLLFSLIPFYSLYYIVTRWSRVREPFLIHLVGWILFLMVI